jgi:hypothetical protein
MSRFFFGSKNQDGARAQDAAGVESNPLNATNQIEYVVGNAMRQV